MGGRDARPGTIVANLSLCRPHHGRAQGCSEDDCRSVQSSTLNPKQLDFLFCWCWCWCWCCRLFAPRVLKSLKTLLMLICATRKGETRDDWSCVKREKEEVE